MFRERMSEEEISSSCPSSAFVAGVMMGVGKRSCSFMPSGIVTPHSVLFPKAYSRQA